MSAVPAVSTTSNATSGAWASWLRVSDGVTCSAQPVTNAPYSRAASLNRLCALPV